MGGVGSRLVEVLGAGLEPLPMDPIHLAVDLVRLLTGPILLVEILGQEGQITLDKIGHLDMAEKTMEIKVDPKVDLVPEALNGHHQKSKKTL
jgi:hypothetical protein